MGKRLQIPWIGEYYMDELIIEARLKGRTEVQEASSLLCAKLMQRAPDRERMIKALADKRGITSEEMRSQILKGKYENDEGDTDVVEMKD
jgi:hypothetical protein